MTLSNSGAIIRSLGIDLASRRYKDIGTALLSCHVPSARRVRDTSPRQSTIEIKPDCITWPTGEVTATAVAGKILEFVNAVGVTAVCIDGPQGWRDPGSSNPGVGRYAERELVTQGKAGEFGRTYPGTQRRWTELSIELFERLAAAGGRRANSVEEFATPSPQMPPPGTFLLLETWPTATWRASGLRPLPAKTKTPPQEIVASAQTLADLLATAWQPDPELSHDDLQAIVAALPGLALQGGPGDARSAGVPGSTTREHQRPDGVIVPQHFVEGLIWTWQPEALLMPR